jgi:hypothetical protein
MEDIPILQQGEMVIAEGKYPSQVVLREVKPGTYATHIKVLPPGAEPYFILGHYFFNLKEAQTDLKKRIDELALL